MLDLKIEKLIFKNGYKYIGAIDEAGRGPLAGPVVACCVILTPNIKISANLSEIRDSKKLTARAREKLFKAIQEEFFSVGIGICDHKTIDRINISQAGFLAMKKAIGALKQKPDFIILDGKFSIPNISTSQQAIINGDELVFSIAAASIVAKVSRDRIMAEMHRAYPRYGFNQHKGYGTKLHLEKLIEFGPCPIHRKSYAPVKRLLAQNNLKQTMDKF